MTGDGALPESIDDLIARIYQSHPPTGQAQPVPQQPKDDSDSEYDPEHASTLVSRMGALRKAATDLRCSSSSKPQSGPSFKTQPSPSPADADAASSIVTWAAAMRHVAKIGQKPSTTQAVTSLIAGHDAHVTEWNDGLYKAVERDRQATAGRKTIDDALKAIGAAPESSGKPKDDEVALFSQHVYAEQRKLHDQMVRRLAEIGIPFFGTKPELIVQDKAEGKVTGEQLKDLRKRMVQHLEDLFREED